MMSLQCILQRASRRAVFHATKRTKRTRINPLWSRIQYRWVSTPSIESLEHLSCVVDDDDDDNGDDEMEPNLEERDRMLEEIRSSLHSNVERILNEKPQIRKKWERIAHHRKRDRPKHQSLPPPTTTPPLALLDLLRQPIEQNAGATAVPAATEPTEPPLSQPLDLLGLLQDDTAFDNLEKEQSPDAVDTTESLDARPTSLMDLLSDDDDAEYQESLSSNEPVEGTMTSLLDTLRKLEKQPASIDSPYEASLAGASLVDDTPAEMGYHATGNVEEPLSVAAAVDEGFSLLLALKRRDWTEIQDVDEDEHDDNPSHEAIVKEDVIVEEEVLEEEQTESDISEEILSDDEHDHVEDDSLLETVETVLEEAALGDVVLSTTDYNALLLSIATASVQTNEAISLMLKTYDQMSELGRAGAECSPDATTYTILMVTLDRKAHAPLSAIDICRQMMNSGVMLSSAALVEGLSCLIRRNQTEDTKRLIHSVLDDDRSQLVIPGWAWTGLLRMYKNENMQDEALNLIDKCLQMNGERYVRSVGNMLLDTISWPHKDRGGHRIDRSSLLEKLVHKLESLSNDGESDNRVEFLGEEGRAASYKPSYRSWKRLVLSLASEADNTINSGWDLVRRAFISMNASLEHSWPDESLLKAGLRAAQVAGDAKLAVDLVLRVHDKQMSEREEIGSSERGMIESKSLWSDDILIAGEQLSGGTNNLTVPDDDSVAIHQDQTEAPVDLDLKPSTGRRKPVRVPLPAYTSAMRLCVAVGDTDSADRLLDCVRGPQSTVAVSLKNDLYLLALKGCAKIGNSDTAEALLTEMQENEMNPTEEAYGTVIHSLAVNKKTKEAIELFESIHSGSVGDDITPGVTCYNARMLAHVEAHEWDKALACHSERKEAGIPWTAASFKDVLLASYRLGNKEKALEVVEEGLESEMSMDYGCCVMSLQILLGDVLKSSNIEQARQRLREIGEENHDLRNPSLNLIRSLRAAEVEEKREPTKGLKQDEIAARRDAAWNEALKHLVEFARVVKKTDLSSPTSG